MCHMRYIFKYETCPTQGRKNWQQNNYRNGLLTSRLNQFKKQTLTHCLSWQTETHQNTFQFNGQPQHRVLLILPDQGFTAWRKTNPTVNTSIPMP